MDITFQLMSKLGSRFTVISVVLWSIISALSPLVAVTQAPNYEFNLPLYQKDIDWLTCPKGWRKVDTKCLYVDTRKITFADAQDYCKRSGGNLLRIRGFNYNQLYGDEITVAVSSSSNNTQGVEESITTIWIGLYRDEGGQFLWTNGQIAQAYEGYWSLNQPSVFQSGIQQCCSLSLVPTEYGKYRWGLGRCEDRRPFVCESEACARDHFQCKDGSRCISNSSVCDGKVDCADESDEQNCRAVCGGYLQGTQKTFHSPNFPQSYPKLSSCHWSIESSIGTKIQLQFDSFEIEELNDFIEIYDGSTVNDPLVGRLSGADTPQVRISSNNILLVIFKSDDSIQLSGFNASWEEVVIDSCGGNLIADSTENWFSSPDYPSSYPPNLICDWVIQAGRDVVSLQFVDFSLEETVDWVEVREGVDDSGPLYGRYSGENVHRVLVSGGDSLFIRLVTNSGGEAKSGFNATYKSGCDLVLPRGALEITSPGYGVESYPGALDCSWTIQDPHHRKLSLIFGANFHTESQFDVVTVFNTSSHDNHPAVFSGKLQPEPIRSNTGFLLVKFSSDSVVSYSGWHASISYDCPSLHPLPDNAKVDTTSTRLGAVVDYSCDKGYYLDLPNPRVCDIGGVWSAPSPRCIVYDCRSPSIPPRGGLVNMNSTEYNGIAVYQCDLGYILQGSSQVRCTESGWEQIPSCQELTCPKISNGVNSWISTIPPGDFQYGAIVNFTCTEHFRMMNASMAYCTAAGQWSSPAPYCAPPLCPEVEILNGRITSPWLRQPMGGETIHIVCDEGYKLPPGVQDTVQCNMRGEYERDIPMCVDIDECKSDSDNTCNKTNSTCRNLPGEYYCDCHQGWYKGDNLEDNFKDCVESHDKDVNECDDRNICEHHCSNFDGGYRCQCDQGYTLYTGEYWVFTKKGLLIPNVSCIVTCPAFDVSEVGEMLADSILLYDRSYIAGTYVYVNCPWGRLPDSPSPVQCQTNGQWTQTITTCQLQTCPDLTPPLNGQVHASNRTAGANVTYECNQGYEPTSCKTRFCQWSPDTGDFQWTGIAPTCKAVDCGPLYHPDNGKVFYGSTTYLAVATYKCYCGFLLYGTSRRVCREDGVWEGQNAFCNPLSCSVPASPLYGSVAQGVPPYIKDSTLAFTCTPPGYTLTDQGSLQCRVRVTQTEKEPVHLQLEVSGLYHVEDGVDIPERCLQLFSNDANIKLWRARLHLKTEACPHLNSHFDLGISSDHSVVRVNSTTIRMNARLQILRISMSDTSLKDSACDCGSRIDQTLATSRSFISVLQATSCPQVTLNPPYLVTRAKSWSCDPGYSIHSSDTVDVCDSGYTPRCLEDLDCIVDDSQISTTVLPSTDMTVPTSTDGQSTETTQQPTSVTETSTVHQSSTESTIASTSSTTSRPETTETTTKSVRSHLALYYQAMLTGNQIDQDECRTTLQAAVNQSIANVYARLSQQLTTYKLCREVTSPIYLVSLTVAQAQLTIIPAFLLTSGVSTVDNNAIESCANAGLQTYIEEKLKNEIENEIQQISGTCAGVSLTDPWFDRSEWECFLGYEIDTTRTLCTYCPDCTEATTSTTVATTAPTVPTTTLPNPGVIPYYVIVMETEIISTGILNFTCIPLLKIAIEEAVQNTSDEIQTGVEFEKTMCSYASNLLIMKTNGKITILDKMLTFTVPFAMQSFTASDANVENCANNEIIPQLNQIFETNLNTRLLELDGICGVLQIHRFHIIESTWECEEGYSVSETSGTHVCIENSPPTEATSTVSMTSVTTPQTDYSSILRLIPVYMAFLSVNIQIPTTPTTACNSEFVEFTGNWLKRNISNWCPAMTGNVSDDSFLVIAHTKISINFTLEISAVSINVTKENLSMCGGMVVSDFLTFFNQTRLTLPTCGSLLVESSRYLGLEFGCSHELDFQENYFYCLSSATSVGYIMTGEVGYTWDVGGGEECLNNLMQEISYEIGVFLKNISREINSTSLCTPDVLLSVRQQNASTRSMYDRAIIKIPFELWSRSGNAGALKSCAPTMETRIINFLKPTFDEEMPYLVDETKCPGIVLDPNVEFRVKQKYMSCPEGTTWDATLVQCLSDNRKKRSTHPYNSNNFWRNRPSQTSSYQDKRQSPFTSPYSSRNRRRLIRGSRPYIRNKQPTRGRPAIMSSTNSKVRYPGMMLYKKWMRQRFREYTNKRPNQSMRGEKWKKKWSVALSDSFNKDKTKTAPSVNLAQNHQNVNPIAPINIRRNQRNVKQIPTLNLVKSASRWQRLQTQSALNMVRGRRSVETHPAVNMVWSTHIPVCRDTERPTFRDCPLSPVFVSLPPGGPVPVNITVPSVYDNSNSSVTVTYSPPDFRTPYIFRKNTTVTVSAVDTSANEARCSFQVILRDTFPPAIECPRSVVIEKYYTNQTIVPIRYQGNYFNLTRDIAQHTFYPQEGSPISIRTHIPVKVTVYDNSGNTASCNFTYEAQRHDSFPIYQLDFSLHFKSVSLSVCNVSSLVKTKVLETINCSAILPQMFNVVVKHVIISQEVANVTAQMWKHPTSLSATPQQMSLCANYATNALDALNNEILHSSNCGEFKLTYSNNSLQKGFTCPNYSVVNGEHQCSQCVLGTFPNSNTSQCESCPGGSEADRHPYCRICSQDIQDDSHCLALCKPGEYSNTGLQPCTKCAKGSYSVNSGSITCTTCPGMSSSTVDIGSSSPSHCTDECPMGAYSLTGLKPCIHCPHHFYSNHTRSTSCTECPRGTGTTSSGGTSQTQCKALDPCYPQVCRNNGTCTSLDHGRFHRCSCLSGFTGESCEDQMNICHSYPCMNGATCLGNSSPNICMCRPGFTGLYCQTDINECESNPCLHGNCVDKLNGYSCTCYPGYKGLGCDTQVNECDSQPCMNGGTCIDMIGEYRCFCNGTGYQGKRCNTSVIDCLPNTCLNLGMCHDFIDDFKCSCLPEFSGTQCEMSKDKCESTPCQNQALCLDGIHNYSCICQPGYTGTNCQDDIDECQSFSCENGGTCIDKVADYDCDCVAGYTGKTCAVNIDDCLPSPCQENNTVNCEDLVAGFRCVCKPGWTGVHCETMLEECTSHPCQNGATCQDIDVDYICNCPKGYSGLDCQVNVDDCASGPCYNGGTCTDSVNSYTCTCQQGFTGARCDSLLDQCSSSPCHNSGTCVSLLGNYSCRCKPGWTGLNCENDVDDCLSMPCHNGGACQDKHLGYNCTCTHDYTGPQCDEAVDPCDLLSCENGGSCVVEGDQVMCVCPPAYTGDVCRDQIDECEVNNPCKNGATCSSSGCQCPPLYTGKHCDKMMTRDFDLVFPGQSGSIVQSPVISLQQTSQLSVCLWVHFRNQTTNMTFLSLHSGSGSELLAMLGDKLVLSFSSPLTVNWAVHDKLWHHVAFTWSDSGQWSVYVDGQVINEGSSYSQQLPMPDKQSMVLGQRSASVTARNPFEGEISQVNVYSLALSQTAIQAMANNCTTSQELGDRHQWAEFSSYLLGNVSVIMPTICGASTCPPGMKGPRCDQVIDKNPPIVHNCTDDILIVSNQRLHRVDWQEPGFSDDVGVKNIIKTHRPGITLSYGQYRVHYTAFDDEGNFAICTFDIFIKPQDCVVPVSPINVQMEWSSWEEGLSLHIACQDSSLQNFPVSVPTWYSCGREGFWDPPQGTDFTLPSCAGVTSAAGSLTGEMKFSGPVCTEESKLSLREDTMAVFVEMYQSLCPSSDCSRVSLHVDCGGLVMGRRRRKRQADTTYSVVFDLPVNGSSLGSSGDAGNLIFETMVKEGSFDTSDFVLDKNNVSIQSAIQCGESGQVLTSDKLCVNCAVGTYKNGETCELCPVGEFSDSEKQTTCQSCPAGTTTKAQGSTTSSHCFTFCPIGQFYSKEKQGCSDCSIGYYQDEAGQVSCKSCPNGQMTTDLGADSQDLCTYACGLGEELTISGTETKCLPCQKGTYRDSVDLLACAPCPYSYTTLTTGANSLLDCSIVECPAGQYRNSTNSCVICPRGTYQPETGQSSCHTCGKGMTTVHPGSTSSSQCYSGPVDECMLRQDDCHANATCIDLPDLYRCECISGFSGNGTYCKDNCKGRCSGNGECRKDDGGTAFCLCNRGFSGNDCQTAEGGLLTITTVSAVGASLAVFTIAVIIIFCVLKRRRAHCKDEDYQHIPRLHREDETVIYPSGIPLRLNPIYLADSDDPTHPVRSSSSIDLEPPWSLHRTRDEPELWRDPSISSESSQESQQIRPTRFNLNHSVDGNFDISESYF
ncbi:uncharacterized protein [Argopecten irradians]|uniref:uncharacterized protein isoform X4 n=1 Tax=Argopecten irradians TaxID=31199 RepID=UPI0037141CB7